jgi:ADP-ribosylglycohydrolase
MGNRNAWGALMGLAVGDALGTTLEFRTDLHPPAFPELATGPHTEITGGGPFRVKPGQVTDDTAMACLLTEGMRPDGGPYGEVANAVPLYLKWLGAGPPDVGNQTRRALELVRSGVEPPEAGRRVWEQSGRRAAGNGSLMRTAPIGVFLASDSERLRAASLRDSAATHFDPRCQLACAALNAAIAAAVVAPQNADRETMATEARRALDGVAMTLRSRYADLADIVETSHQLLAEDLQAAQRSDPSTCGHQREVDEMAVIDTFDDSSVAMKHYLDLHAVAPERELYVVHSSRPSLDIVERTWLGIRKAG